MDALHYFLLVNIYLVLFYAFYALFLKNETFFKLNRFYLVGGAAMSFLIPFLQSDWIRSLFITKQVEEVTQNITFVFGGPELVIQAEDTSWGASEILLSVYLAGAAFFLLRFIWQLYMVNAILKSREADQALSFFHTVKVGTEVPNRDTVLDHEMVHARQWHSADVILFEIITIVNWFNPVVYLYRKAIKHIHEFTADEIAAANEESKTAYAMLLVSKTFGIPTHQLTNSFYNQSLLKRRIIMLHKSKSTRNALLKYGLSAPLFAAMMILSSATVSSKIESIDESIQASNVIQDVTFPDIINSAENKAIPNQADLKTPILEDMNTAYEGSLTDTVPDITFTQVEVSPEPVGGFQTFYDYIIQNFKYTDAAKEKSVAGKIILQMVVEADGQLADINVLRGLGSGLDEEAVRVLNQSPKWKPGIQNGKPVKVKFTLPISVNPPGQKTGATVDRIEDGMWVSDIPENALFILDGKEVKRDAIIDLDTKSIKLVNILKGESALEQYGQKGKDGVVEIFFSNTPPVTASTASKKIGSTGVTVKDNKMDGANYKGLTILDGVEITNLALKELDPKTIQSMNVLNAESAVKKYGSRAKEGAIEITSKEQ